MVMGENIREHMEVVGSDGGHVGRVDKVAGTEIELWPCSTWDQASSTT